MTRITFLMPRLSLNGGIRVIGEYGRELIRLGHEVNFVARDQQPSRLRDILRLRAPLRPIREYPSDFFSEVSDRLHIFPARRSLRPYDLPEADFLVATWWETVEWALPMPASKGRLAHLMQHYEMFPYLPHDRVARTYEADTLKIAVSGWIADQVMAHHGKPSAAVIHNAVDAANFAYRAERENEVPVLGFVYAEPAMKNSRLAFALADRLARQGVKVRLVAFSADVMPPELAARPDTTFHYRPAQSLIPKLYQGCDLWLFPSLEEGFGLPLLEAMSCGTPVVSGKAGAAPQVVRDGENGYLCEPTAESFAAAVTRHLALAGDERRAMSARARRSVTDWTWADAAKEFAAVLQNAGATA